MSLFDNITKLANEHPELRPLLTPILKTAGGVDFEVFGKGSDPKAVFYKLVEEARHESGHGGYTGTIAEKHEFRIRETGLTRWEAQEYAAKDIDHNDKWGPAFAVGVVESKDEDKTVTGTVRAKNENEARELARDAAAKQIKMKPGVSVTVGGVRVQLEKAGGKIPLAKLDPKSMMEDQVWGYRMMGKGGYVQDSYCNGQRFGSREDVKKQIQLRLDKPNDPIREPGTKVLVYKLTPAAGFQVGDSKGALPSWAYVAQVKVSEKGKNTIGWLFYGVASS